MPHVFGKPVVLIQRRPVDAVAPDAGHVCSGADMAPQPFNLSLTAVRFSSTAIRYGLHRNRLSPSKPSKLSAATSTTIRPGEISGTTATLTTTGRLRTGSWQPSVT